MDNTRKEQYAKIIELLKKKPIANREDISKCIGEQWHSGKMLAILSRLESDGFIRQVKNHVYSITTKGEKFESFDKIEEDESWQIRLAKSNIEANELQKSIAEKNEQNEKINRRLMRTTIAVGIATIVAILIQILSIVITIE